MIYYLEIIGLLSHCHIARNVKMISFSFRRYWSMGMITENQYLISVSDALRMERLLFEGYLT